MAVQIQCCSHQNSNLAIMHHLLFYQALCKYYNQIWIEHCQSTFNFYLIRFQSGLQYYMFHNELYLSTYTLVCSFSPCYNEEYLKKKKNTNNPAIFNSRICPSAFAQTEREWVWLCELPYEELQGFSSTNLASSGWCGSTNLGLAYPQLWWDRSFFLLFFFKER